MAMPVSNRATMVLFPLRFGLCQYKNQKVAQMVWRRPPMVTSTDRYWNGGRSPGIVQGQPKAAPQEVPTNPGSTIGFRNNPATILHLRQASPTKRFKEPLGSRISIKIRSFKAVDWYLQRRAKRLKYLLQRQLNRTIPHWKTKPPTG